MNPLIALRCSGHIHKEMIVKLNRIIPYLLVSSLFLVGCYLFLTYQVVPFNRDAGYYIPIAKAVMNGSTPTVDVHTSYTPFIYYVYSFWMSLFGTSTENLILLVYVVNVLNGIIFYIIVSKFIDSQMLAVVLAISYFFTTMVCQGYTIILEPFQVLFILIAFAFYLSGIKGHLRHFLIGLSFGISIMFKQYSCLVVIGFLITILIDYKRLPRDSVKFREIFFTLSSVLVFSAIPLFLFIALTDAEAVSALNAFGFLGDRAVSYSTAESVTLHAMLRNVMIKVVHLNWLFIPPLLYAMLLVFKNRFSISVMTMAEVLPIFLFSALPILIRQFGHYFLLIAPWSYIIAAILLNTTFKEPYSQGKQGMFLFLVISLCVFILIPLFVFLTPAFNDLSRSQQALYTSFLIFSVMLVLFIWLSLGKLFMNSKVYILIILIILCAETVFLVLKIPFSELSKVKEAQLLEAKQVSEVFIRGSEVLVVDDPVLYILCDYKNPENNYSFIKPLNIEKRLRAVDFDKVSKVIVKKDNPVNQSGFFEQRGFRKVWNVHKADLIFFTR